MKIYEVGGCVRDRALGLEPKDIDYVVVGSNPEEMLSLGYQQVGKDFPVFLSKDGDEYALARTERKTGNGYGGFTVNSDGVTLEEDLYRRDLTINAMAMDTDGNIIDPYNGLDDLKNKTIRHVSRHFAEDPLRVLRAARFAARYGFKISPETLDLMKELASTGELSNLVKERIWLETTKVFEASGDASVYFKYLQETGALSETYKIDSVNFDKISEISTNEKLSKEEKTAILYLLSYSNPDVINKIDNFDDNKVDGKLADLDKIDFKNKKMYAPSAYTRLRNQFEKVVSFGKYYEKTAEEKLELIKVLRALQNKETIEFCYNTISLITTNEIVMDIAQRSKEIMLSDVAVLEQLNFDEIIANSDKKDVGKNMEIAQIAALKAHVKIVDDIYKKDIEHNSHIKHGRPSFLN